METSLSPDLHRGVHQIDKLQPGSHDSNLRKSSKEISSIEKYNLFYKLQPLWIYLASPQTLPGRKGKWRTEGNKREDAERNLVEDTDEVKSVDPIESLKWKGK